ncbi:metallophosphoesterase family protein [Enterovirga aerilata]|uniref:Serine/threonine protein phosphatase n=1 Tax=Enterovirga aerilata TaxID=2730920 RepID=A0A849IHQ7_9HYPH|nr:metallophosphoesterase family protein [Enterovirga sp. DB1703]NNM73463.1 serine/threonine protein phosphatase [Enterovirga sp. DB1703]
MLTYAVGDIHGCLDLLVALLSRIEADAAGRRHRLVFVGDYIDRGPDSAGVIRTLRSLQAQRGGEVVCLKGNHEDLYLRSFGRPEVLRNWLYNGGDAMLASFGAGGIEEVPADVTAWIASCPVSFEDEWRYYVHAGLRPGRLLDEQSEYDRIWIRDEFLVGDHDFGKFVVHGHTPRPDGRPDLRRHRVNLDTAAVYGGRLTAARFGDEQAAPEAFLQVD